MQLAVIMSKDAYDAGGSIPVLGVEIVDPVVYSAVSGLPINFTNPVDGTQYIKRVVAVAEDNYKTSIVSNFDSCHYDKTTNTIVPDYTNPTNRAIASYDERYPMAMDNPIIR